MKLTIIKEVDNDDTEITDDGDGNIGILAAFGETTDAAVGDGDDDCDNVTDAAANVVVRRPIAI